MQAFCFVWAMKNNQIKRPDEFDIYMMMPSGLHDMPGSIDRWQDSSQRQESKFPRNVTHLRGCEKDKGECCIIGCQCDLEIACRPLGFDSWT